MLPAVDRLGVARAGSGGDHGVGRPAGRIGLAGEGGAGDESAAGSGQDVDVPAEPSGQDALRGVPSAGSAAEEQPDGIGGEASEPTGEGDGEVLVWRRGRGGAAIAGRPAQRRQAPGRVLAAPASGGHGAEPLPPRRLTTNCVVRPAYTGDADASRREIQARRRADQLLFRQDAFLTPGNTKVRRWLGYDQPDRAAARRHARRAVAAGRRRRRAARPPGVHPAPLGSRNRPAARHAGGEARRRPRTPRPPVARRPGRRGRVTVTDVLKDVLDRISGKGRRRRRTPRRKPRAGAAFTNYREEAGDN